MYCYGTVWVLGFDCYGKREGRKRESQNQHDAMFLRYRPDSIHAPDIALFKVSCHSDGSAYSKRTICV